MKPAGNAPWQCLASRKAALIWMLIHLILGVVYSVVTPAWEAHDEWAHYKYAEYVAQQRALPPAGTYLSQGFGFEETTQPPLYYVLAAIPLTFVNTADEVTPVPNPYATTGTGAGGVNMAVHDWDAEGFPWQGTYLGLHLARFISVLISLAGVWFAYALARFLLPEQPAVVFLSTAFVALFPQYLFIGSVVTNDILIAVLGMAVLYFSCRVALDEFSLPHLAGLGVSLGGAFLTKYTALGLMPLAVLALCIAAVRAGRRHAYKQVAIIISLPAAGLILIAGWWYWHNVHQYGTLFSRDADVLAQFLSGVKGDAGALPSLSPRDIGSALWYGFQTLWVSFGWGNVGMPEQAYIPIAVLCGLATAGAGVYLFIRDGSRRAKVGVLLLGFTTILMVFLLLFREMVIGAAILRGRLLLPVLPAIAFILALGALWWLPQRLRPPLAVGFALALLIFGAALPFTLIQPSYAPPALLPSDALPPDAVPIQFRFGTHAELFGYKLWPETVRKGQAVGVTLYWRALQGSEDNFSLGVYALGAEGQPYGEVVRYPGWGNFATSLWKPGDIFSEVVWIPIQSDRPAPCLGRISVTLFLDSPSPEHLPVTDEQDHPAGYSAIFGRFKIAPAEARAQEILPAEAVFNNEIALVDVEFPRSLTVGDVVPIRARFQALRRPAGDYVLFFHLLDEEGKQWWGKDGPPALGNYPTDLWDAGEVILEQREMKLPPILPPGRYHLALGWYRLETLERVPASAPNGSPLPDAAWRSPAIEIVPPASRSYLPLVSTSTAVSATQ